MPPDASSLDASPEAATDVGPDAGDAGVCFPFDRVDVCDATCPEPATLNIRALSSVSTAALITPSGLAFDPNDPTRAYVISAEGVFGRLSVDGDGAAFDTTRDLEIGRAIATGLAVSPSGEWAVASVLDIDCEPGTLYFIDLVRDPGVVLDTVMVGIWPDHVAVSPDGRYVVTADEDQREGCKPADRHGGSITIIDVGAGPTAARVVQTLMVDHALDSEPEGVTIGAEGTVVVSVQETDELVVFDLDDVPDATQTRIAMPSGSNPDGVSIEDSLGLVAVAFERTDEVALVSLASASVVYRRDLVAEADVPSEYNRDASGSVEIHEPEELLFFRHRGALFLAVTIQESHAVLVYRVEGETLILDSVAPTGDYETERGGRNQSAIRPEALAVEPRAGLFLAGNEREGSITLIASGETRFVGCE
jgi:DNA-binding beta-propeller fold protein YncE